MRTSALTQGSGRSSGVEHNLAKVRVGRSNRLARSNIPNIGIKHGTASAVLLFFVRRLRDAYGIGTRERISSALSGL